jgi:ribose 5-phosphate isomerase A
VRLNEIRAEGVCVDAKAVAAKRAVLLVQDGMTVGLGSGTTATYAIQFIGERMRNEGIRVVGVPTSRSTNALAETEGIPLVDITCSGGIDLTIDGADEVDSRLNLIKGGGGALVREKIVAAASRQLVIICDDSKIHTELGWFPLPVAVVPFAWHTTRERLLRICPMVTLRKQRNSDAAFETDDGNLILDLHMESIPDPAALEAKISSLIGVVDVGLFVNLASRVVIGCADGTCREIAAGEL